MRMILAVASLTPFLLACTTITDSTLTSDDSEAMRSLSKAYTNGWQQSGTEQQAAAVLPLFTDQATIMPGAGGQPHTGLDNLRVFWFPENGIPTNVKMFEQEIDDIDGNGKFGLVSGRYELEFEYAGDHYHQVGNFMMSMNKQSDGEWLIDSFIWNDRRVQEE